MSYRVAYGTSSGNTTFRVIDPTPFSTIEDATRLMRAYKRRGLWTWIEDDQGNFIPVPGAKSERVRKGYPLRSEQHATKKTAARGRGAQKSPAQLDREIAAALAGRSAHSTKQEDVEAALGQQRKTYRSSAHYLQSKAEQAEQARLQRHHKPGLPEHSAEWERREERYRDEVQRLARVQRKLEKSRRRGGGRAHSTIGRDDELMPTAEARRHVQTIQRREEFPEILAISMRADGTNYQVKVPDPKNKNGYDLVDVLIHHNGMRSIKSASRSRTNPDRASKIVSKYLATI